MQSLSVNGKTYKVDVPDDMPLLWVLRDILDMKGTKFGCGMGLCGACTVHFNGAAIRSCSFPVSGASNGSITTIEGLAASDERFTKAWTQHNVPQCGYCQSGQIMSAAALLTTNIKPNDADIDSAMSGNICRCGTYQRIKAAIKTAAGMDK